MSLPDDQADTSNVVFGANFYMAFFVAQQSTYDLVTGQETLTAVEMQIFVSHDDSSTAAYIGNQLYPIGPNPFAPVPPPAPTPSSSDAGWIIALVIVVLILAGFLGWAVWKWRVTSSQ